MNIALFILIAIAVIPAVLLLYAVSSALLQLIFNKNYNYKVMHEKWQLNSTPVLALVIIGVSNIINDVLFDNPDVRAAVPIAFVIAFYCYLSIMIGHHAKKFFAKL